MGRLREIKTKEVYYFDFIDNGFPDMKKQRFRKMPLYKKRTNGNIKHMSFDMRTVLKYGISRGKYGVSR